MTARGVVFQAPNQVAIGELAINPPDPDEVTIEPMYTTISPGTELAWLQQLPNATAKFPMYPGYSGCGMITAVGGAVKGLKVGDRVVAMLNHLSKSNRMSTECVKVPDSLDSLLASAYMLVSIALQGVRKPDIQLGESVAVIGLGPIGNLAGQIARAAGATFVAGIDSQSWRCEIAKKSGFDAVGTTIDEFKDRPIDIVIEATGAPEPVNLAFQLVRRMGRVVLLGSTRGVTREVNFYRDVHHKCLTIHGAHTAARAATQNIGHYFTWEADARTSVELLASGRVSTAPILTEAVPAADGVKAFGRLLARQEQIMTFALDWTNFK